MLLLRQLFRCGLISLVPLYSQSDVQFHDVNVDLVIFYAAKREKPLLSSTKSYNKLLMGIYSSWRDVGL